MQENNLEARNKGVEEYSEYTVKESDDRLTKLHKQQIGLALGEYELVCLALNTPTNSTRQYKIVHEQFKQAQSLLLEMQLDYHKDKKGKLKVLNDAL